MDINVFWFRRDLRLFDNAGLYACLREGKPVLPVFIFDRHILDDLVTDPPSADRRVVFIHEALLRLEEQLNKAGSSLQVFYGYPEEVFDRLAGQYAISKVFANTDYEPYARHRDEGVARRISLHGIKFRSFKDQVVFGPEEVLKDDSKPYTVFTPYMRRWRAALNNSGIHAHASERFPDSFLQSAPAAWPTLEEMGFKNTGFDFPGSVIDSGMLADYGDKRDFPAASGTSRLGVHLRFGTVSVRQVIRTALEAGAEIFVNELVWREFYMMILYHFPHVVSHAFKPAYDAIPWRHDEGDFRLWCAGKTGYPLVDAGMRELEATGYMHNRVRMVTASFLTKHLLIDWRWGEAWFAKKLLDFELASNNGGWQWAAGTGCDAAPYFRIFNPESQQKKFDPEYAYVRRWVPEWGGPGYPRPMVNHKSVRERAIRVYREALQGK